LKVARVVRPCYWGTVGKVKQEMKVQRRRTSSHFK
jgi:hypothetical protein